MDISHRTPGRVRRRRDIIMLVGESEQNRGAVLTLLIGVSTKWLTERPRSRMLMNDGGGAELRLLAGFGRSVVGCECCSRCTCRLPCPGLPQRVLYRARLTAALGRPVLEPGNAVGGRFTVTQHF